MAAFRILLVVFTIAIIAYTLPVGFAHGWNLGPVFFGDIAAMTWAGQFNFDFLCFLILSGLWVSWRHAFSPSGFALGFLALIGGIMFLAPYLLWTLTKAEGDMARLFLGQNYPSARL